jgi:hypothetical protein
MCRASESRFGGVPLATGMAIAVVVIVAMGARLDGATTTRPSVTQPSAAQPSQGPDVVVLKELVSLYDPVPFDHKTHAQMAEMWEGCTTCHHRTPDAATQPADQAPSPALSDYGHVTQDDAAVVPACKHCHAVAEPKAEIHMPSLKGAYHRQCLNCHREWSGANDCVICHRPRDGAPATASSLPTTTAPTRDDIVGRMHPPLPAPDQKLYKTRFTPVDGGNVLFRHAGHVKSYGLKCANCHFRDSCNHCHDPKGDVPERKILKPAETWAESHGPCVSCHTGRAHCRSCHYKDGQSAPPPFEHAVTGQSLDQDHAGLKCVQCHAKLRSKQELACGGGACHARDPTIAYPNRRPGPLVTTRPLFGPGAVPLGPTRGVLR